MPPMIRKAIQLCIDTIENPGPEWSLQDVGEAKGMLEHLLIQRFKFDRSNKAIVAAGRAVLEADPPRSET